MHLLLSLTNTVILYEIRLQFNVFCIVLSNGHSKLESFFCRPIKLGQFSTVIKNIILSCLKIVNTILIRIFGVMYTNKYHFTVRNVSNIINLNCFQYICTIILHNDTHCTIWCYLILLPKLSCNTSRKLFRLYGPWWQLSNEPNVNVLHLCELGSEIKYQIQLGQPKGKV